MYNQTSHNLCTHPHSVSSPRLLSSVPMSVPSLCPVGIYCYCSTTVSQYHNMYRTTVPQYVPQATVNCMYTIPAKPIHLQQRPRREPALRLSLKWNEWIIHNGTASSFPFRVRAACAVHSTGGRRGAGRAVTFNETRRGALPGVIEMIALLSGIADVCKAL